MEDESQVRRGSSDIYIQLLGDVRCHDVELLGNYGGGQCLDLEMGEDKGKDGVNYGVDGGRGGRGHAMETGCCHCHCLCGGPAKN
eukprot:7464479-Ditylum_brightwellii.AAC.1